MDIAIIGYGRMGREVEKAAIAAGDSVVGVFDIDTPATVDALRPADVCIEFSVPDAVPGNMKMAAEAGVDIVVGATGWYDRLDEVRTWFTDSALLYAQNFSIGVNVFLPHCAARRRIRWTGCPSTTCTSKNGTIAEKWIVRAGPPCGLARLFSMRSNARPESWKAPPMERFPANRFKFRRPGPAMSRGFIRWVSTPRPITLN